MKDIINYIDKRIAYLSGGDIGKSLAESCTDELIVMELQKLKSFILLPHEDKWHIIPHQCEYQGKVYRILDIDMQGGLFTLYNPEAQKGEIQVIDDVDIEKCNPI